MRRIHRIGALLLAALILGLYAGAAAEARVRVIIEETEGCAVEDNGQWALPGEDVTFTLRLERGYSLSRVLYSGEYTAETKQRQVTLTLKNIRFPTRVKLELTTRYATIVYEGNGGLRPDGQAEAVSKTYSLTVRPRPNVDTGTGLFLREGYTLTGWNTRADGTGERVGLGSRVTVTGSEMTLYAQWAAWEDAASFDWTEADGAVTLTGYHGASRTLVIPEKIVGLPVRRIAAGAFEGCGAESVILPSTLWEAEANAFRSAALREVTFFDCVVSLPDAAFAGCEALTTLRINAVEAPYGYLYRKESCYADKVDLLIRAQGKRKMVFYGGCSMWYNLDGIQADRAFGDSYTVIDMGLNGTVSSAVQMQIMGAYLESGDLLVHTPELASSAQLMFTTGMDEGNSLLWAGLENNYDLVSLVDRREVSGMLDSLCAYLSIKDRRTDYLQTYTDENGETYMDAYGCVPFYRAATAKSLSDTVALRPERFTAERLAPLNRYYRWYEGKGVRVVISCACVNLDALPEEQAALVEETDAAFKTAIAALNGPPVISALRDYLYHNGDFFDTNYHLNTAPAKENTAKWIADLRAHADEWEVAP